MASILKVSSVAAGVAAVFNVGGALIETWFEACIMPPPDDDVELLER